MDGRVGYNLMPHGKDALACLCWIKMSLVPIGLAFVMCVLSKNQARDNDFNMLQMKAREHVFAVVDEWAIIQIIVRQ